MTFTTVRYTVLSLTVVCFLGAGLFAWWVTPRGQIVTFIRTPASEAPNALQIFERACTRCHDRTDLLQQLHASAEPKLTAEKWLGFLTTHGSASNIEDRALIQDFLANPPNP